MKISNVLKNFIKEEITNGNTNATIYHYKTHINFFINFFGDKDINKITYKVYQEYIEYLRNKYKESSGFKNRKEYLSGRTIKTYASALKTFLTYSYENGYLRQDVSRKIKMPKYKKKIIKILNMKEINILINSFDKNTFNGCRDLFIISIMLDSGARLSEVVRLKEIDFDFENKTIKLDGKGQKERLVPFTTFIQNCYKLYKNKYIETFKLDIKKEDFLLKTIYNKNITKNTISLICRRIRKKILIDIHPHLLRHTFATWFLLNGGDIHTLQIILGHTTLHMVLNYLHLANQINLSLKIQYTPLSNIQNPIGQKKTSLC